MFRDFHIGLYLVAPCYVLSCMFSSLFFLASVWIENPKCQVITLKVLVATIDAQWKGMRDVGSARYELALLPPCPTIRVLSYSN